MRDGAVHTGECVVTKGEPTNPHKPEELTAKFFELGEPVWGRPGYAEAQRRVDEARGRSAAFGRSPTNSSYEPACGTKNPLAQRTPGKT
jgi:hypothetical protein